MTLDVSIGFAATLFCVVLALAVACRRRWSLASVCFCVGMLAFAADSGLSAVAMLKLLPDEMIAWEKYSLIAKSFQPGVWLAFSLTYSRGDYTESLRRWQFVLAATVLIPIGMAIVFQRHLFGIATDFESGLQWIRRGHAALTLNLVILVGIVLILMNLERTFRSAVGTMRWRIKFLILGLAVIFGTRVYTRTQGVLISGFDPMWSTVEAIGLLIGCTLITVGYVRRGFEEVDVYPSRAVLQSSLTVILVGGYLLVVGVLAHIATALGGSRSFPVQTALVLVAIIVLAILLLSDRAREGMRRLTSLHFKRPQYDSRRVWTRLLQSTSSLLDRDSLSTAIGRLISETFGVLSVTVWLLDKGAQRFQLGTSTVLIRKRANTSNSDVVATESLVSRLRQHRDPFDLDRSKEEWMAPLEELVATNFRKGGQRICIPLVAGEYVVGLVILADRINGDSYTVEELDLLKCIGDHFSANLLSLRLTGELMEARELEAFQTMSAFFIHDLKNTASSMNLMLQNLPVHFDDPEFRKDALRTISKSVKRINSIIERLSALRSKLEICPEKCDFNELVSEAVASLDGSPDVELVKDRHSVPFVMADREQLRSVIINLLLNARDAMTGGGLIRVETGTLEGDAVISVVDSGCGMSPEFVKDSLFRPFRSTKKKGLGIGMFQSKMIVEAHRGRLQVESELGRGTTFRVRLPMVE